MLLFVYSKNSLICWPSYMRPSKRFDSWCLLVLGLRYSSVCNVADRELKLHSAVEWQNVCWGCWSSVMDCLQDSWPGRATIINVAQVLGHILFSLPVMWSETIGLKTRLVWDKKSVLVLHTVVLVLVLQVWCCVVKHCLVTLIVVMILKDSVRGLSVSGKTSSPYGKVRVPSLRPSSLAAVELCDILVLADVGCARILMLNESSSCMYYSIWCIVCLCL